MYGLLTAAYRGHRIRFKSVLYRKGVWRYLISVELKQHEFYAFLFINNRFTEDSRREKNVLLIFMTDFSPKDKISTKDSIRSLKNLLSKISRKFPNIEQNTMSRFEKLFREFVEKGRTDDKIDNEDLAFLEELFSKISTTKEEFNDVDLELIGYLKFFIQQMYDKGKK